MNNLLIVLGFFVLVSMVSCDTESKVEAPDTSHIHFSELAFIRFDQMVSKMNADKVEQAYLNVVERHPIFTDLYFKRILNFPSENQDSFYSTISSFLKADAIIRLQDTIDHIYPNTKDVEAEFVQAFKFLKYYFPQYKIPDVYFFQSEFGYQTIIFSDMEKDGVAVGLDMFLGEDFNYKKIDPRNPAFSDYLTRSYNKDHIVRKTLWMILDDIVGQANGKRFIDQIIHKGKKLYILDKLMPFTNDTIVYEFSEDQWNWLNSNELEMWTYFLENELMYETNHLKIDKYVNPAPNSPGMPATAPGRTGAFIGSKIIEAYMKRNPEADIKKLIALTDAQKLMEMSKYKPKRR